MNRVGWYFAANLGFLLLVAAGSLVGSASGAHPLYVILLFALCSSPILHLRRLNDRYALLAAFLAIYFLFYGVLDLEHLLRGTPGGPGERGMLSRAEWVILLGGALAVAGYHFACRSLGGAGTAPAKDWTERSVVLLGIVLWIVCTWLSWEFKVNVLVDTSIEAQERGLAGISRLQSSALMIGVTLQPLSILMLVYAQRRYRRAYLTPIVIAAVLVQLVFGFVIDVKGEALIGAALVILTKLLVDGKVPAGWLLAFAAFIAVAFPVLQANRVVRGEYAVDRQQAARMIAQVFERARDMTERVNSGPVRANTFFERMSLKTSVELIVARTGHGVPYQHGYTLTPVLTAFIPRLIWPTKPDVQVGRVMNKEFQISEVAATYISPSHLGELYWNFGVPGVAVGMPLIGLLLGFIGVRFNLAEAPTLTRLMIIVATIQLIILGFEGPIAPRYVMWMRSMLGVALLHMLFARLPVRGRSPSDSTSEGEISKDSKQSLPPAFPNLIR